MHVSLICLPGSCGFSRVSAPDGQADPAHPVDRDYGSIIHSWEHARFALWSRDGTQQPHTSSEEHWETGAKEKQEALGKDKIKIKDGNVIYS